MIQPEEHEWLFPCNPHLCSSINALVLDKLHSLKCHCGNPSILAFLFFYCVWSLPNVLIHISCPIVCNSFAFWDFFTFNVFACRLSLFHSHVDCLLFPCWRVWYFTCMTAMSAHWCRPTATVNIHTYKHSHNIWSGLFLLTLTVLSQSISILWLQISYFGIFVVNATMLGTVDRLSWVTHCGKLVRVRADMCTHSMLD